MVKGLDEGEQAKGQSQQDESTSGGSRFGFRQWLYFDVRWGSTSQNDQVHNLGILLDPILLHDKQVALVARAAFCQLRLPGMPAATLPSKEDLKASWPEEDHLQFGV